MTAARRTTVAASLVLVLSMVASTVLLRRIDQKRIHPNTDANEDMLFFDSPKMVKRASLGFDSLMACIYWTRTVQYFGTRHHNQATSYNQLAPLLEITTALDPQLVPAYQFGASFLAPAPPNGAGEPERAVRLMQYGIEHNPDNWQLYYNLGFVYYTELHDYRKASEAFARGAEVPNAHPFMKVMAAQMAEHAGEYSTARMLWTATYETNREKDIRDNALEHLRSIKVDEDVSNLQDAVTRFQERTGRLPANMQELAAAEHLPAVPVDPDGNPYVMSPEGRVLVENPESFLFITQGLPPGYKPSGRLRFHSK